MVVNINNSAEFAYMGKSFDRMAKSQGIYSMTKGFNEADLQKTFLPDLFGE